MTTATDPPPSPLPSSPQAHPSPEPSGPHSTPAWHAALHAELAALSSQQLRRELRPLTHRGRLVTDAGGKTRINFAGNDYLGLSTHPALRDAAAKAAMELGVGSGASRLVTGHSTQIQAFEQRFAAFKHAEAALLCPTGFTANLAVLTSLAAQGDLICLDKLCHASLLDAARAAGCEVRVYPHLELAKLRRLLQRHATQAAQAATTASRTPRRFIVTDSVFSMDGDVADLPALCQLAQEFDAILVVDEAHGTGVLGDTGAGLAELQGVTGQVPIIISTLSKALGGLGGIVTGPKVVIDTLIQRARSFIYTTAVTPPQVAAADAALDMLRDEPGLRARLLENARRLRAIAADAGLLPEAVAKASVVTPIVPLVVGQSAAAIALAEHLRACGIEAPAIRPPTVAPGAARVRLTVRADHTEADLAALEDALRSWRTPA